VVAASNPTVLKRYVALELLRLRTAAGFTRDDTAAELSCTYGHVRHLEIARSLPSPLEVKALMPYYGVAERVASFLALVDAARKGKDWWEDLPGIPEWLDLLLGMEAAAAAIHLYDTMIVTGLFQTPGYAEAVIRAGEPELSDIEVQQRVELRMARQDVLTRRPEAPGIWCVLDEAVLHRRAVQPGVLAEQIEHLVKLSELPNVHIQLLPFTEPGLHAGMNGTFTVITFGPELVGDPGVAYTESRISGVYYEKAAEIMRYRDTWSRVQVQALTPEETRTALVRRVEEIA
jgi:transcriptional regulator with XRE-family HTH domain